MARFYPIGGSGVGVSSSEVSATSDTVLSGRTYVGADTNDDIGTGTMPDNSTTTSNGTVPGVSSEYPTIPVRESPNLILLTDTNGTNRIVMDPVKGYYPGGGNSYISRPASDFGTAQAQYVMKDQTFTSQNGVNIPGTMTVNSILSFSAQAYSGRQVLLKWQNPYAVSGRPFSNIVIKYDTAGYPQWDVGPALYVGVGDNTTPGGWSQVVIEMPALSTTYYFTAISQARTSVADLYSPNYYPESVFHASCATGGPLYVNFTESRSYTIPSGYTKADIFCVGGGGSGDGRSVGYNSVYYGSGGAGGYTTLDTNKSITAGQVLNVVVGAAGSSSYISGVSSTAAGGGNAVGATSKVQGHGGNGGSGGGAAGGYWEGEDGSRRYSPGAGGSDGGNGGSGGTTYGTGQGTTTRAWGSPTGTLYSGGGGGACYYTNEWSGASGGAGGGGTGGTMWSDFSITSGSSGGTNTGGGGGAGYGGGSGIVLLKLY